MYGSVSIPVGDMATWAAVGVAVAGVIATVLQHFELKRANRTAQAAAEAAQKAAIEAEKSVRFYATNEGGRLDVSQVLQDGGSPALYLVCLKNIGRTAVILRKVRAERILAVNARDLHRMDWPGAAGFVEFKSQLLIMPGEEMGHPESGTLLHERIPYPLHEDAAIKAFERRFYIRGYAVYETLVGEVFQLDFCREYNPNTYAFYAEPVFFANNHRKLDRHVA